MEVVGGGSREVLNSFLAWCKQHNVNLSSKIRMTNIDTSHRFGIVALEDIRSNETLVEIPRNIALTSSQSSIASRLESFKERQIDRLQQTSGWISLLLALMHEIKKNDSFWAPYLALCPSFDEFNQPMFWSEEERHEELAGLSVLWDVQRDLYNIEREYQQFAVPFIEENKDRMSKDIHDLSLYKRMVGFVMSYSFTDHESNETLMVPVGDIFNHHTNNNAQLSFDDESLLRMISTKPIKKGEEIFNTFGKLGNSHLLHMYGFVEKHQNPSDSVELSLTQIVDCIESNDAAKLPLLQAMLALMRKMGIADEKDPFVFNASGLKSGPDLYAVLRVCIEILFSRDASSIVDRISGILHMDFKEFCGLLQDHISWYQDSYFLYLLKHVNEAAVKEQNGEGEDPVVKDDDSDDDVIIVREVKGSGSKGGTEVPESVGTNKAENATPCTTSKKDGGTLEVATVEEKRANEQKIEDPADGCSPSAVTKSDMGTEAPTCDGAPKGHKKDSSTSDGSKKTKNRKRKQTVPIEDSDDSDEEVNIKKIKSINDKTRNINFSEKGNSDKKNDKKEEKMPLDAKVGSKEETAKWVLQLPNYHNEEHSEDPDDESDDEDSDSLLQLTYEQINSVLPTSWKVTMRNVVANALGQMKQDLPQSNPGTVSQHAFLAKQVRSGQRRILQLLKKSLAS